MLITFNRTSHCQALKILAGTSISDIQQSLKPSPQPPQPWTRNHPSLDLTQRETMVLKRQASLIQIETMCHACTCLAPEAAAPRRSWFSSMEMVKILGRLTSCAIRCGHSLIWTSCLWSILTMECMRTRMGPQRRKSWTTLSSFTTLYLMCRRRRRKTSWSWVDRWAVVQRHIWPRSTTQVTCS